MCRTLLDELMGDGIFLGFKDQEQPHIVRDGIIIDVYYFRIG
jgi:hypothetical protein